jgi:hypothetical protein
MRPVHDEAQVQKVIEVQMKRGGRREGGGGRKK